MTSQTLFYAAFTAQILTISYFIPRTIANRMRAVLAEHPPETYPRLYPRSPEFYESRRSMYRYANGFIVIIGLVVLAALIATPHDYDIDNAVALIYFLVQAMPLLWLDISLRRELKLMRELDTRSTRSAALNPRRLFDVISPALLSAVVGVYLMFWVFTTWFSQFGYPWFGGHTNNLIITAMNVVFAAGFAWRMYGKKLDPHMSEHDRIRRLRSLASVLAMVSIAATLFAVLTIMLSAAEAKEYRPFAVSLYYQLIALMSLQAYRFSARNVEVYREDVSAT